MFLAAAILGFAVFMYFVYSRSIKLRVGTQRHAPALPEAGGAWPLIGHLHLFREFKAPHVILGDLADKYGPILAVKLGFLRLVIVSNSEVAKECFTTNDKALGGRTKNPVSEILGYNYAVISLGPGGSHWRQVRKIMALEFFSNQKLEIFKRVGESEVRDFMRKIIRKSCSNNEKVAVVEMWRWFEDINMSVIFRMLAGKSYLEDDEEEVEKNERFEKAFNALFEVAPKIALAGSLPFMIRWLYARGIIRDLKKTAEDLDRVLQGWVEEHKHKRMSGKVKGNEDFIYAILSFLDDDVEERFDNYDSDTFVKATCLALIMGGVDATTLTLTWALSLLLNNPDVMKKAQQELDTHVGKERQVRVSDLENLVYLQAILKETLRLYPPGPLNAPHQATEDCTVSGYHVPAGTTIMVNIFKIQRDPNTWPDPNAFKPERFLTSSYKDFEFRGHNYELMPFSAGRRMCPGISYALQVTQLILANLLHCFDIVSATDGPVDLTESVFLNNFKMTKTLEVLLSPRLPAHVYD